MPSHALQTLVFLQGMPYNLAVVNEIREHLVGFPVVPEDTTYEWSRTAAPTVADKARTSCAASSVSLVFFVCLSTWCGVVAQRWSVIAVSPQACTFLVVPVLFTLIFL